MLCALKRMARVEPFERGIERRRADARTGNHPVRDGTQIQFREGVGHRPRGFAGGDDVDRGRLEENERSARMRGAQETRRRDGVDGGAENLFGV